MRKKNVAKWGQTEKQDEIIAKEEFVLEAEKLRPDKKDQLALVLAGLIRKQATQDTGG